MPEFLTAVANGSVLVFVVASMLAAGLNLRVREVLGPLSRPRLVAAAVAANFVLAPAVAYLLTIALPLRQPHAIGLLLLGGAAGAPFLPKLAELARGDVAFSVGLMLLLMVGSVAFMPVALPLMVPGLHADPWLIARPLLVTMLLPLAAGMVVRGRSERLASRLRPVASGVTNISLILLVVLLVGLNFDGMIGTLGSGAVLAALLFVSTLMAAGYALGGPGWGTRSVLGLGTGQRNIAAALVTAVENYRDDPEVVIMLLVVTFAGLVPLLIAAVKLRPQKGSPSADR